MTFAYIIAFLQTLLEVAFYRPLSTAATLSTMARLSSLIITLFQDTTLLSRHSLSRAPMVKSLVLSGRVIELAKQFRQNKRLQLAPLRKLWTNIRTDNIKWCLFSTISPPTTMSSYCVGTLFTFQMCQLACIILISLYPSIGSAFARYCRSFYKTAGLPKK